MLDSVEDISKGRKEIYELSQEFVSSSHGHQVRLPLEKNASLNGLRRARPQRVIA